MSRINLLPWREEVRRVKNRIFFAIVGVVAASSIVVLVLVEMFLSWRIEVQNANVAYLNTELDNIKAEITEIQGLQGSKKHLLERMGVIRSLQADRPSIVKLLDIMPRIIPETIYLTTLSRSFPREGELEIHAAPDEKSNFSAMNSLINNKPEDKTKDKTTEVAKNQYLVQVEGVAQTNGSISTFLKKLEGVRWLSDVKLNEVSINKEGSGLNFKLQFVQHLPVKEE